MGQEQKGQEYDNLLLTTFLTKGALHGIAGSFALKCLGYHQMQLNSLTYNSKLLTKTIYSSLFLLTKKLGFQEQVKCQKFQIK